VRYGVVKGAYTHRAQRRQEGQVGQAHPQHRRAVRAVSRGVGTRYCGPTLTLATQTHLEDSWSASTGRHTCSASLPAAAAGSRGDRPARASLGANVFDFHIIVEGWFGTRAHGPRRFAGVIRRRGLNGAFRSRFVSRYEVAQLTRMMYFVIYTLRQRGTAVGGHGEPQERAACHVPRRCGRPKLSSAPRWERNKAGRKRHTHARVSRAARKSTRAVRTAW
jgi:hypothetical protein